MEDERINTFCVVAQQGQRRFIYGTFYTYGGASICVGGLREDGCVNTDGFLRKIDEVIIVLIHTPEFRRADYQMPDVERDLVLAAPATKMTFDLVTGEPIYTPSVRIPS